MTALPRVIGSRWLKPMLGLTVTGLFLWLILDQVELQELVAAFSRLSLPWLVLALALLAVDYALRILRWWLMLRPGAPNLSPQACAWPYLASIAVNNVLPFRAGDALRAFGFRRELRSPATRVLGTLVLERLLDMATLLTLFFFGFQAVASDQFPPAIALAVAWLAGVTAATLAILMLLSPRLFELVRWAAHQPVIASRGWSATLERWGGDFVETFSVLRRAGSALALFGLSVAIWLAESGVFGAVALSIAPSTPSVAAVFATATGTLSTLIPSSPGYVGTFDYFTLVAFAAFGLPESQAAAIAFTVHAVLWVPLTLIGLSYLLFRGRGLLARSLAASRSGEDRV
jgi:uncharacterized protein (TIRG00374 family)